MNRTKRELLALAIVMGTLLSVQCAEKEGPINPEIGMELPPYVLENLAATPARVEPGEQAAIEATLLDRHGDPVSDLEVTFTVEAGFGSIDPVRDTTDVNGGVRATYTAPSSEGVATITVGAVSAASKPVTVQVGQGALSVDPQSILADGISTAILSVTLVDADGAPIPNALVSFSTDKGSIAEASPKTDANGYASATLVSVASQTDVTANITAVITHAGIRSTEIALVTMRGVSISVSADPTKIPADGISTSLIKAQVKETTSNVPVAGVEVEFRASLGVIGVSVISDQNGFAEAPLLSSTTAGVADVTASYGGLSGSTDVVLGSLALFLRATQATMVADGVSSQYVVATLLTEDNNPVGGVIIDFSTSHGVITRSVSTDSRGRAAALLASSSQPAIAQVVASFKGVYSDAVQVSFENPVLALKALPMSVKAKPLNVVSIVAYVSFGNGMPVPDSTVVKLQTSQGSLTPSAITTSGIASATLRPNGVADDAVTIRATCGNSSQTTLVMFTPDVPAQILIHALPDTVAGGGTSFSTVVAEVTDAYGNHVEDGTLVTFSVVAGNGLVSPSALTSGGLATARFTPTGGGVARVRAQCELVSADAGIVVLAQMPGAVIADPDTGWISVSGGQDRDQAVITAHVYDSYMNPVDEGTEVVFEIQYGPGGGEYLDDPAYGYGPVTKETAGGMASVTINSGTKPGTVLMTISAGGTVATAAKVGISSGLPDSIFVTTGKVVVGPDCIYTLAVGALVRDKFNNPVENGTVVYFTLDRSDVGLIDPETVTGNGYPCTEFGGRPDKGVTRACLRFPTSSMTEPVSIIARCGDRESSFPTVLPIVTPVRLNAGPVPGTVKGSTGGEVSILVSLSDDCALPIGGATIAFSIEGSGTLSAYFATTDDNGSCMTTLTIPPGTEIGKIQVKVSVFMTDVTADIEVLVL